MVGCGGEEAASTLAKSVSWGICSYWKLRGAPGVWFLVESLSGAYPSLQTELAFHPSPGEVAQVVL